MDEANSAGIRNRKLVNQRRTTNSEDGRRKERHRRKGRRRHDTWEEEDEEEWHGSGAHEEVLPKWKLCLVVAAIFLCFALLYPSVFSPMLSNLFGGGVSRQQQSSPSSDRPMHPSMAGPNQQRDRAAAHRPPLHHPGASMRMPDAQQSQHGGGFWGGKSGGSLAWMLPFYTVGVVCFLLYTLFKSKNKRQKRCRDRTYGHLFGEEEEEDDEGTEDGMEYGVRGAKLRSVQHRLRKTEKAMADILGQLEQLSANSQQFVGANEVKQEVGDPNLAPHVQRGQESSEEQKATTATDDGAAKAQTMISEEQTAKVEQSLRELKMLSELCKSDRRLRQKLRATLRQQNHSSSSSSTNSEGGDFEGEEEDEEEWHGEMGEEEEEEENGYNEEDEEGKESEGEEEEEQQRTDRGGGDE